MTNGLEPAVRHPSAVYSPRSQDFLPAQAADLRVASAFGQLPQLIFDESLCVGTAVAGNYVRTAVTPIFARLSDFIELTIYTGMTLLATCRVSSIVCDALVDHPNLIVIHQQGALRRTASVELFDEERTHV